MADRRAKLSHVRRRHQHACYRNIESETEMLHCVRIWKLNTLRRCTSCLHVSAATLYVGYVAKITVVEKLYCAFVLLQTSPVFQGENIAAYNCIWNMNHKHSVRLCQKSSSWHHPWHCPSIAAHLLLSTQHNFSSLMPNRAISDRLTYKKQ